MNDAKPTFILPGCAKCSHGRTVESPRWNYAHRTSAREKRGFYMWTGCDHAQALRNTFPVGEPAEWKKTEDAWAAETMRLFHERTATWTEVQREDMARALGIPFPPRPETTPAPEPIQDCPI